MVSSISRIAFSALICRGSGESAFPFLSAPLPLTVLGLAEDLESVFTFPDLDGEADEAVLFFKATPSFLLFVEGEAPDLAVVAVADFESGFVVAADGLVDGAFVFSADLDFCSLPEGEAAFLVEPELLTGLANFDLTESTVWVGFD
jgi:hypothetical protein